MPKNVKSYEAEWMSIAQTIAASGSFLLPVGNKAKAAYYRLRFYGFRNALAAHDPANPWLGALMETQVALTPEGNLSFERSPLSTLLRGLLENVQVSLPREDDTPFVPQMDQTLLELGYGSGGKKE